MLTLSTVVRIRRATFTKYLAQEAQSEHNKYQLNYYKIFSAKKYFSGQSPKGKKIFPGIRKATYNYQIVIHILRYSFHRQMSSKCLL